MDPTQEQRVCIRFCANLGKSAMEALAMIGQIFKKDFMSRKCGYDLENGKQEIITYNDDVSYKKY
jgi:hypothetical protein